MTHKTSKNSFRAILSISILACAALIISGAAWAGGRYIDADRAQLGDDGLVYGVPYEDTDGSMVIPDMTRVRGVNGNYGYVSTDQMNRATLGCPETEEEFHEGIKGLADATAKGLVAATEEYFGTPMVSYDMGLECRTLMEQNSNGTMVSDYLDKEIGDEIYKLVIDGSLSPEKSALLICDAINDGTINSEMICAKLQDVAINDTAVTSEVVADAIAIENGDLSMYSLAELSNANPITVKDIATQLVYSDLSSFLTPDMVSIDSETYSDLHELIQKYTCVSIPVYASDGKTVIDEYHVNII